MNPTDASLERRVRAALGKRFESLYLQREFPTLPPQPWRVGWYVTWSRWNGSKGTGRAEFVEQIWELILLVEERGEA